MSNFLRQACDDCVEERGIKDAVIADMVYEYMEHHYEDEGKSWNYAIIDQVIDELK